jgi:hypothetical protein
MRQFPNNVACWMAILAMAAVAPWVSHAQSLETSETRVEAPYFEYDEPPPPLYAFSAEMLWLSRTAADANQSIITGADLVATTNVVRMADLILPTEAGVRASLLLGPPTGRYFEFTYAGIFDQDTSVTVAPNAVLQTTQRFFGANSTLFAGFQHTATYESDLHSAEFNVWSDGEYWRLRPFFGARWIQQEEFFQVFETQTPGNGGLAGFSNNLIGLQSGFATVLYQRADWFHVQATAKGGVYHNGMDLDASWNAGGVPVATLDRESNGTSCSGQIDLTAVWQLTPYLNFHVGYTGLWLTEVGLVGNQNDNFDILTGTGELDLGGVSYQGGHLGVTLAR